MIVRIAAWLAEPWPLWLWVFGILGAWFLGGVASDQLDRQIRFAGVSLQVLGVVTVAIGLSKARRLFGRPSLRDHAVRWLRRLPSVLRPGKHAAGGSMAAVLPGLEGKGYGITRPPPGSSIEERVSALEQSVGQIHNRISQVEQTVRRDVTDLHGAVDRERDERVTEDLELAKKLEEFSVGGLHLEAMGVTWLLVGVVMATIPQELAPLFTW